MSWWFLISIKQRLENSCKRNRWLRARLRYLQCAAIEIPQSRTKPAMESSRVRDARVAVSVRYNDSNLVVIWDRDTIYLAHIDGLVQDCSNSIANALELLPACTKPSICTLWTASSPIGQKPDDEDINCDSKPLSWILWCVLLSTCIFKFRWQSYDRSERGGFNLRHPHIDGLVQERRNSSALAMELRLYCTNPLT